MKKKSAQKGEVSSWMSPPIQINNIPYPSDDAIGQASVELSLIFESALNVVSMKRSISKRRKQDNEELREAARVIERKIEEDTRAEALRIVSVLMKRLHEFAKESDIYILDIHPESLEDLSLLSLRK